MIVITSENNVVNYVGNNKIFSDNIENFSETHFRRVESRVQLGDDVNLCDAVARFKRRLAELPNVL